ncbi:GMC oxidoreductase [Flavimaricola marinus]|uniref:6'''-hydroxyparomomycin C oxidase n=1 Tax=Flavimaricola marinus TaxID=1819565 RepID=A0A238LBU3_9RHOB|nr:GMC family oxidoreductase [Flavimaricola marinus]SMY06875.1 6'''-hydroxyparomomycin C oxidase [Flavimaricola marinus]
MIDDIAAQKWDAIVIGTGIGGGTIGRALAEAGLKVLFVEKGHAGHRAEQTPLDAAMADPVARAVRGFWPDPVHATVDGQARSFHAPLGSGIGGSSVFYAATLERPEPHDLDTSNEKPHPTGGWPVSYAQMAPWFDRAEALYSLHGSADPLSTIAAPQLRDGPAPNPGDTAIMDRLRENGLHPYRLHAALRYVPGCAECFGHKCPKPCKMDGRSAGVEPALATGNATVLDRAEVTRLHADETRLTGVEIRRDGVSHTLHGKRIILAAGALSSPRVLLASANEQWPHGLANASDQVGRNLMFHLNEMFALWPGRDARFTGPSKAVGFRDLYHHKGQRLGMVQAMGIDASYGEIAHYLKGLVERSALRNSRLARELTRIPALAASKLLGNAKIFVGLLEDLPLPENRVRLDPDTPGAIRFDYTVSAELKSRRDTFRKAIKHAFKGQRTMFLSRTPEPNFGHPCGTCKMGEDPTKSVLAPDGRAHGVENLWVVDASFMPTSMGVNPSLTIAANALRVASLITQEQP